MRLVVTGEGTATVLLVLFGCKLLWFLSSLYSVALALVKKCFSGGGGTLVPYRWRETSACSKVSALGSFLLYAFVEVVVYF